MSMDINILREAVTVMSFIVFIGIVLFAALPGNEERFNEAARIPLDDELPPGPKGEGPDVGRDFANWGHR